ncbi:MAG: hypothetical protein ACOC9Y_10655, partial [Chloroflexota bacterium]
MRATLEGAMGASPQDNTDPEQNNGRRRRAVDGQVLVMFAAGLLLLIGMVALAVDAARAQATVGEIS